MPLIPETSSKPYETDWETIAQDRFEIMLGLEKRIAELEAEIVRKDRMLLALFIRLDGQTAEEP